jgi:uridine kinase
MEAMLAPLLQAVRVALAATPTSVILIDGPSGAGKSTLADRLVAAWPGARHPVLVRMDDLYPGWGGLEAGSALVHKELLRSRGEARTARWQRYDWETAAPGEWVRVDAERPLIVEGCGTLLRENVPFSTLRVWITADDEVRKRRALERDHGGFDAHWDEWQRQFDAFVAREHPIECANLVLDGTT